MIFTLFGNKKAGYVRSEMRSEDDITGLLKSLILIIRVPAQFLIR
jgi:hypothetical protein